MRFVHTVDAPQVVSHGKSMFPRRELKADGVRQEGGVAVAKHCF